jgi:hypothetical protein
MNTFTPTELATSADIVINKIKNNEKLSDAEKYFIIQYLKAKKTADEIFKECGLI